MYKYEIYGVDTASKNWISLSLLKGMSIIGLSKIKKRPS